MTFVYLPFIFFLPLCFTSVGHLWSSLSKILGYDLALENLVEKNLEGNKTVYYASSLNEKKYVPNFLIEKDIEVDDLDTLLNGLKLVGDYLDKTILRPNNLNYPNSRLLFLNTLK